MRAISDIQASTHRVRTDVALAPVSGGRSLLADDNLPRRGRRRAVITHKGGVGKTMTTVYLGEALARAGHRVLLVDLDPQGNLTRRTAVRNADVAVTLGEVLQTKEKGGAAAAVYPCGWETPEAALIDVIPADLTLVDRDLEAAQPGSFGRLNRVLYGVTDAYDYTLFDCRPTLGHLEQMVTRCLESDGDGYYLVVEPGHDAISGAYRVTQELARWADDMEVAAPALGAIVNLYDGQTRLHKGRVGALDESLTPLDSDGQPTAQAPPVLQPYIRRAIRIGELQDLALPSSGDARMKREGHLATFDALAEAVAW